MDAPIPLTDLYALVPAAEEEAGPELPPLRQVLGLLAHELGAQVVDDPHGGVALPRLDTPTEA